MKEWLSYLSGQAIEIIDAIALLVILIGTVEVCIAAVRGTLSRWDSHDMRTVWLRYARWLVAGLTFQLAADILETSITTDWQSIGRVGAIAVIRTFLNFFLDRDLEQIRVRQRQGKPVEQAPPS
jgi:uncharacterized membrane protein